MEYALIVLCEVTGSVTVDTDTVVEDFTDRFIELFGSETLATQAVLQAIDYEHVFKPNRNCRWKGGECLVFNPLAGDSIREQYFQSCDYAFRVWVYGKPDELEIILGVRRQ